jgi:uncharacterized protein (TIGR03545 family)
MASSSSLIRWKMALPLLGAVIALFVYGWLFLDGHVRHLLEGLASDLNGAEVNIGELRTSVFGGFVEIKKVELTHPERPDRNRLELGSLRFDLETVALLKAKVLIREASLQDIQILSPRKKPGFVLPPPPPPPPGSGPSMKDKAMQAFAPVKQELMKNALALLQEKGLNPLGDIDWKEMPSTLAIQELQKTLEQKPAEWKALTDQLPKPEKLAELKTRLQALTKTSDPASIQKNLAELEALQKEAQAQTALIQNVGEKIKTESESLSKQVGDVSSFAKQDMALLQQRLKWPDLDFKGLAEELVGPEIKRYLGLLQFYYAKLAPFLESKEKPAPSRPLRMAGTDYSFPITDGLPSFWLRKAQISSKATPEGPLGNVLGTMTDLSSDPALLAQPLRVSLDGSFPQLEIDGLKVEATLDHRQAMAEDSLSLAIAAFPVAEKVLSESENFVLGLHKAKGRMALSFVLRGEDINLQLSSQFEQLTYRVESATERVKSFLDKSLADVQMIRMEAKATGPWDGLQWAIQSNLAEQLRSALRQTLSQELAAEQEKIKAQVEARLQEEQKKLEQKLKDQLAPFERQLLGSQGEAKGLSEGIDGQKNQINQAVEAEKAAVQAKVDAEKKKQEEKAKQELKNKIKLPGLGK